MSARPVLDSGRVGRVLLRIAHEILERNGGVDLALVGIRTTGVPLAGRLAATMESIEGRAPDLGSVDVTMYRDDQGRQICFAHNSGGCTRGDRCNFQHDGIATFSTFTF